VEEEEPEEGGPKPEPFFPESVIIIKSTIFIMTNQYIGLDRKNKDTYSTKLLEFFAERNLED
jgi:hypothetical protein